MIRWGLAVLCAALIGCGTESSEVVAPDAGPTVDAAEPSPELPDSGPVQVTALAQCSLSVDGPSDLQAGAIAQVREPDGPGRHHAAACGLLVWASPQGGLWLRDLTDPDGPAIQLVEDGNNARWPHIVGGDRPHVAYVTGDMGQVQLVDLSTSDTITVDAGKGAQKRPRISLADQVLTVAWEDERSGPANIRLWSQSLDGSASATVEAVDPSDADQRFVSLDGADLVWMDFREDPDGRWDGQGTDAADIHGRMNKSVLAVAQGPHKQGFPELHQGKLVWLDWRNVPHDENGYPRPEPKFNFFEIHGGVLVDGVATDTFVVGNVHNGTLDGLPTLHGETVAWTTGSGGSAHILGARFEPNAITVSLADSAGDTPLLFGGYLAYRAAVPDDPQAHGVVTVVGVQTMFSE